MKIVIRLSSTILFLSFAKSLVVDQELGQLMDSPGDPKMAPAVAAPPPLELGYCVGWKLLTGQCITMTTSTSTTTTMTTIRPPPKYRIRRPIRTTTTMATPTCPANYFQCGNGQCILASFYCDNEIDCDDFTDESSCPKTSTESGLNLADRASYQKVKIVNSTITMLGTTAGNQWPQMVEAMDHVINFYFMTMLSMAKECNWTAEDKMGWLTKHSEFKCKLVGVEASKIIGQKQVGYLNYSNNNIDTTSQGVTSTISSMARWADYVLQNVHLYAEVKERARALNLIVLNLAGELREAMLVRQKTRPACNWNLKHRQLAEKWLSQIWETFEKETIEVHEKALAQIQRYTSGIASVSVDLFRNDYRQELSGYRDAVSAALFKHFPDT